MSLNQNVPTKSTATKAKQETETVNSNNLNQPLLRGGWDRN